MREATTRVRMDGDRPRFFRRKFQLQVLRGPERGLTVSSASERFTVGTAAQNDLVLTDPSVSRHHLRIEVTARGFLLSDLDSTNGTSAGSLRLGQCYADSPIELLLGESLLRFAPLAEEEEVTILEAEAFGSLLGRSACMRELFQTLERVAPSDATVLLEGETGTGKELVAREIHQHSARRAGPFVVVDCGAIPPALIESELFGHTRGAFTGAIGDRAGALEEADGGTVFLDEIGELEPSMQPRLLRALEQRQVKRIGEVRHRRVDLRVVAATNRDLQRAVNQGSFRADLFYRLAVVHLRVAPLRERPEDVALLALHLLPEVAARLGLPAPRLDAVAVQQLVQHPWPGNVRELRNLLERMVVLSGGGAAADPAAMEPEPPRSEPVISALPFKEAKARWLASFEPSYLREVLERCGYNVAEAARQSGIDRVHLFRLIKKYRLRRGHMS